MGLPKKSSYITGLLSLIVIIVLSMPTQATAKDHDDDDNKPKPTAASTATPLPTSRPTATPQATAQPTNAPSSTPMPSNTATPAPTATSIISLPIVAITVPPIGGHQAIPDPSQAPRQEDSEKKNSQRNQERVASVETPVITPPILYYPYYPSTIEALKTPQPYIAPKIQRATPVPTTKTVNRPTVSQPTVIRAPIALFKSFNSPRSYYADTLIPPHWTALLLILCSLLFICGLAMVQPAFFTHLRALNLQNHLRRLHQPQRSVGYTSGYWGK